MPVPPVSQPSFEPSPETRKVEAELSGVEKKTGEVAAPAMEKGVLPEAPLPLISQHEISIVSPKLLRSDLPLTAVETTLSSVFGEKGISGTANIGIEAVAARRFNKTMNALLESAGYNPLCTEYDVESFHEKDLIFTEEGVTIAGIEEHDIPEFIAAVRASNPELADRIEKFHTEKKLSCVSDKMVTDVNHMADDRFSEVATALVGKLVEEAPSEETTETEEAETEEAETEERAESEETEVETSEEEEEEITEEGEKEIETPKKITIESQPVQITRNDVVGDIINNLAINILSKEMRRETKAQEAREEKSRRQAEELKHEAREQEVLREDIKHQREEQEVRKESIKKAGFKEKVKDIESGKIKARHEIGESVKKTKAGEPTSPPSPPTSSLSG